MPEFQIIQEESISISREIIRPNFLDFDEEVVSWEISMGNSMETEDTMSITFTRIPRYKGERLSKGMSLQMQVQGVGTIDMIIREIDFNMSSDESTTTILLGTRKIEMDTHIPRGYSMAKDSPSPAEALDDIAKSKLSINFSEIITDPSIKWPVKKVTIGGTQNVLDYFKSSLSVGSKPVYSFWIDAFNRLRLHHRSGVDQAPLQMDFNTILPYLVSLNARIFNSRRDKDIIAEFDKNLERTTGTQEVPSINLQVSAANAEVSAPKGFSKKRKARADANPTFEVQKPALEKNLIHSQFLKLVMVGTFWLKTHLKSRLSNFPLTDIDSSEYVLTSINISESGGNPPQTTYMFETINEEIPELKSTPGKESMLKRRQSKGININVDPNTAETTIRTER